VALTGGELGPGPGGARGQPDIGLGAGKPHFWQLQSSVPSLKRPSRRSRAPGASLRQRRPAPTHMTLAALPAAHATRGSSELATTTAPVASRHAWRQRWATWRTSLLRSSWSRLRLSNTSTDGRTCAATRPTTPRPPPVRRVPRPARRPMQQPGPRHVGAQQVGDHRATPAIGCGQARGQELGSGRLAIGARDQHDLAAAGQHAKRGGVDGEDGVPADDRTRPAPSGPGKSAGAAAHHHRQARPEV